jgi:hypothetical protein
MAKKFMFVCVGILALTIAFLLGAQFGRAEYVEPSATGILAASEYYNRTYVLTDNGVFGWNEADRGWYLPDNGLPMPVSQVKFLIHSGAFISKANDLWYYDGYAWVNEGPPPGGAPTPTEPSTWGSIKARFKN